MKYVCDMQCLCGAIPAAIRSQEFVVRSEEKHHA
jgi:hypothetical protein